MADGVDDRVVAQVRQVGRPDPAVRLDRVEQPQEFDLALPGPDRRTVLLDTLARRMIRQVIAVQAVGRPEDPVEPRVFRLRQAALVHQTRDDPDGERAPAEAEEIDGVALFVVVGEGLVDLHYVGPQAETERHAQ